MAVAAAAAGGFAKEDSDPVARASYFLPQVACPPGTTGAKAHQTGHESQNLRHDDADHQKNRVDKAHNVVDQHKDIVKQARAAVGRSKPPCDVKEHRGETVAPNERHQF